MKIKMSCKLCELSETKFGGVGAACTHNPFVVGQPPPVFQPLGLGIQNSPVIHIPQIRDMMLAAYLLRGYYQPAGPLITVPHGHHQPPSLTKNAPLSETSPSSSTPPPSSNQPPPPPPSSNGDSSDSEVIITSVTTGKETLNTHPPNAYRYSQYPSTPPGYAYAYPYHYSTPPSNVYNHHELCYPPPNPYLSKYPPYRRYPATASYYPTNPQEMYPQPAGPAQNTQQVVTASPSSGSASNYQPLQNGHPPPTLIESYPPPPPPTIVEPFQPPPHYYAPGYGPPPSCYTHSPPRAAIPYINATYQSCPCPMQSCPKNVHTGPLTGDSKRSNISSIAKDSRPLQPVVLALPLEPASATGPPSPARGSAGMPPPPSPAGATYQTPPAPAAPKQESQSPETAELDNLEENKRKARVGKAMVRNTIQSTMLLMCNPAQNFVKREIESPKEKEGLVEKKEFCSDEESPPQTNPQSIETKPVKDKDEVETVKDCDDLKQDKLPPCISTVAENVKVKNMKRKLSFTSEKLPVENQNKKKQKVEDVYFSSYKNFIKKDTDKVNINNGRRKLINRPILSKSKRVKSKANRRMKLKAAILKNSNVSEKEVIEESVLINGKRKKVRNNGKLASALLDNLILKNSVDRTIDSVISDSSVRTVGKVEKPVKSGKIVQKKCTNENAKCETAKGKNENKKLNVKRRKSKSKEVVPLVISRPRKSLQAPKWSNGWKWEGEPYEAKVFLNSDETTLLRTCYPAMRHEEGDIIEVKDCVLLKAGPKKNDLPYVAKIAALWENPEDGEMMMSLLWYYRPEHTEQGRQPTDQPDEVFASRHKDSNSVACIDDKCYVLTFNEYCRYRKSFKRLEEGIEETQPCIPIPEPYPRLNRQPPCSLQVSSEMVFFCRRVYDFRQKRIVKNPT